MTRRRALRWIFSSAIAIVAGGERALFADAKQAPPFVVIVNPANPGSSFDRKFLADAFLKKVTRWPGGDVIRPVDLPADSWTRARFSDDVLNRSVAAVKSYWQQIIFSGRDVPPPELANDGEVLKFVAQNPWAVGYVSGTAVLDGVKPIRVE